MTKTPFLRALKLGWDFCYRVVDTFLEDGGLQHSATIAFFALLSILPFTLFAVSMLAGLAQGLPFGDTEYSPVDQVLDPLNQAVPFLGGGMRDLVEDLARKERSLGWLNLGALIFAASAGFNAVSEGINAMLATKSERHFLLTRLFVTVLMIGSVSVLFVAKVTLDLVGLWADALGLVAPQWLTGAEIFQLVVQVVGAGVGFYFLVKLMALSPYKRRYRWIGAGVFVVFFQLAQDGFGIYLEQLASYDRFYGTAGAFFGLALWLYVAAIVLLGSCMVIRIIADLRAEAA